MKTCCFQDCLQEVEVLTEDGVCLDCALLQCHECPVCQTLSRPIEIKNNKLIIICIKCEHTFLIGEDMILLHVKGDKLATLNEANRRGIVLKEIEQHESKASKGYFWTKCFAPKEAEEKIMKWFMDIHKSPWPDGTCLFYE